MRTRLTLGLYRCLLAFYPTGFRTEFEAEMKAVFTQALVEQRASTARLLWRELRDWPGMVWRIHLAERRKMMAHMDSLQAQPSSAYQPVPAGTWREAWLAALSFLLIFWEAVGWEFLVPVRELFNLTYALQRYLTAGIFFAVIAIDLGVVVLGWRRSWPRWSLPFLGVVLTLLLFLALAGIDNSGGLSIFITPLVFLFILFVAALGARWKVLQPLYERMRGDLTLLGLAYFSCLPVVFVFMLDETRYETRVELVLYTILALGVVAYMRSASLWQRVVVLPGSFAAASLVATVYRGWYFQGRQPWLASDTFRLLSGLEVLGIVPLLIVGILELWRYGSQRRLQAA